MKNLAPRAPISGQSKPSNLFYLKKNLQEVRNYFSRLLNVLLKDLTTVFDSFHLLKPTNQKMDFPLFSGLCVVKVANRDLFLKNSTPNEHSNLYYSLLQLEIQEPPFLSLFTRHYLLQEKWWLEGLSQDYVR